MLVVSFFSACTTQKKVVYQITVKGEAKEAGVIYYLNTSMNVYKDLASNSCGTCENQPVSVYKGADAQEIAQAIAEAVTRADDLWEVKSCENGVVVLQEKTAGSVESIANLSGPAGLEFTGEVLNGSLAIKGNEVQNVESSSSNSDENQSHERLAAIYGPSYEMLVVLGAEDKIVVRADVQTDDFPFASKVFKRIDSVPKLDNVHTSVNIEELMTYNPDMVYTFPRENELAQLKKLNVSVLAGQSDENLSTVTKQLMDYAQTLDDTAKEKALEYQQYFDTKLKMVTDITSKIENKPKVYYAGTDILTTYGKYSDIIEVITAAGGTAVSANLEGSSRTQINYEQLMSWNPEYIFLDHGGMNGAQNVLQMKEDVMTDSRYQSVVAVKNSDVYVVPSGVFYWDMGLQKILLVMQMAKTLHPEEFQSLDMKNELKTFYQKFYDYSLSDEEVTAILNRQE
jgi:iron complex transport system substrate-binding protein